jgi:hypothetical protein
MADYANEPARPFVAVIDNDGVIYRAEPGRKQLAVGIDTERERELLEPIQNLLNMV